MEYTILKDHYVNQEYKNYIQPYNQNIFEIINSRLKNIDEKWYTKKILDFGCNVGHLLNYSNGLIDNYVGVDVQKESLEIASNFFPSSEWIYYNGYHPAFNPTGTELFPSLNKKFDYIICIGVFTHCDFNHIKKLINNFKKNLKDDGKIIFSIWERKHFYLYSKVFLLNKFNIKLNNKEFKNFKNSIYLIDRKYTITDTDEFSLKKCTWIETFFDRKFILENIKNSRILEGIYSKHTIYMI